METKSVEKMHAGKLHRNASKSVISVMLILMLAVWCANGIAQGPPGRGMGERPGPPPDRFMGDRPGPPPDGSRSERPGPPPEPNVEECTQLAKEKLGLSDLQSEQLTALLKTRNTNVKKLREKEAEILEEQRNAMKTLHEDFQKQLKALLTEEQQKALDALPPPEQGRILGFGPRGPRGGRGPDGRGRAPENMRPGNPSRDAMPRGDRPDRPPRRGEGPWGPPPEPGVEGAPAGECPAQ